MVVPQDGDVGADADTFLVNCLVEDPRVTACDGYIYLLTAWAFHIFIPIIRP